MSPDHEHISPGHRQGRRSQAHRQGRRSQAHQGCSQQGCQGPRSEQVPATVPAVTASNLPPLVYGEELPVQFANDLQAAGISGPALAWLTSGGPITHISSVGSEVCSMWAGAEPGNIDVSTGLPVPVAVSNWLTDPQVSYVEHGTPPPAGIKASQVPVVEAIIKRDICQNPDNQF